MGRGRKNYLEIGVFNGHIFFRIKSRTKIAVDPEFRFDIWRKLAKVVFNPYNVFNQYYSEKSDDFFRLHADDIFKSKKIEVALVDGMHEYSYALRDTENILKYLDDDGVIILHDCNPATRENAVSFNEWKEDGMKGEWNGDVWKAIVHLRSFRRDIDVFVADCDYGLGIITKRKPESILHFSQDEIDKFEHADLAANRKEWLNLKSPGYLKEYFNIS